MTNVEDFASRLRALEGDPSPADLKSLPKDDQRFLAAISALLKMDMAPVIKEAIHEELSALFGADPDAGNKLAMLVAISQSLAELDPERVKWFVARHDQSVRSVWGKEKDMLSSVIDSAWTWHMVRPVLKWTVLITLGLIGLFDGGGVTEWLKGLVGLI